MTTPAINRRLVTKADLVFNQIHMAHPDRAAFIAHGELAVAFASRFNVKVEPVPFRLLLADVPQLVFDVADHAKRTGRSFDPAAVTFSFWQVIGRTHVGVVIIDNTQSRGRYLAIDAEEVRYHLHDLQSQIGWQERYTKFLEETLGRLL